MPDLPVMIVYICALAHLGLIKPSLFHHSLYSVCLKWQYLVIQTFSNVFGYELNA